MSTAKEAITIETGSQTEGKKEGRIRKFWKTYFEADANWLKEVRGHLITAATLTATMAYQSILSPPGSFWQETKGNRRANLLAKSPSSEEEYQRAGQAIMDRDGSFDNFLRLNTMVLGLSFSTIMLAISGFPPKNKFLTWLLVFFVYGTLAFMTAAYLIAANFISPDQFPDDALFLLTLGGMGMGTFILLIHSGHFFVWLRERHVKNKLEAS